jgi:phenylacetate-CoA ligase
MLWARQRAPYWQRRTAQIPDELIATAPERALQLIEPLEKAALQQRAAELRASGRVGRISRKTTGGSTGQAVTVVKDAAALASEMAASWLGYGWSGIRLGDRAVRFWGQPAAAQRRLRFLAADIAMHRRRFSAFAFGPEDLERYWRTCITFRPDYFYGYVSMLVAFAEFVEARGYDGASLGLRAVVTTSEVLAEPQARLLARVFGCQVQNEYGCGELGPIAYSFPEGALHIMALNVWVEVLSPTGEAVAPGESGDLVVTDLHNRAMPLLRYRVGDQGALGGFCRCGRPWPVLDRIWGRAYDFVEGIDARRYHGEFFLYFFEDLRERGFRVEQFQVTQQDRQSLRFDIVVAPENEAAVRQAISSWLARALPGMHGTVRSVPAIQRAASGKMRLIVNAMAERSSSPA